MSSANRFLSNFKVRVDKVTDQHAFIVRVGRCIANAKTTQAKWRLYEAAILRLNYDWMQYIDKLSA